MSNPYPMQSDWHRVGAGLSVRFTLSPGRLDAQWLPHVPTKREMKRVLVGYRMARDSFLADHALRTGRAVLCLEMPL